MKPIPRWRWAASAWAAAALVSFAVGVVGWFVGFLAMGITTGSWTLAIPALGLYAAAAIGYTAVFVPIGYLFTRAILVGLAYVFVWEGIITTVVTGLAASSVWRTAMSIYADLTVLPGDALETLGPVAPGRGRGSAQTGRHRRRRGRCPDLGAPPTRRPLERNLNLGYAASHEGTGYGLQMARQDPTCPFRNRLPVSTGS